MTQVIAIDSSGRAKGAAEATPALVGTPVIAGRAQATPEP
jgi:hypothetical protein